MEHVIADPLRERYPRILITGGGGQLAAALADAFADDDSRPIDQLGREEWDVSEPGTDLGGFHLVLHTAAWTNVDGAQLHEEDASRVNVEGTRNVAALGAPFVYFSTDYVFDGAKSKPYLESDKPAPISVYGKTKLEGEKIAEDASAWIVRSSWLFGWGGRNFVQTMLALGREPDRSQIEVVDDQRGCPTYVGHLAAAVREVVTLDRGIWHLAADGDCTWAELAEAIFEEAEVDCEVIRISSEKLARPARRPPYSVLRSERRDAPRLPHWREGVRAYLELERKLGFGW